MAYFEWAEDLVIDRGPIDQDHRHLIDLARHHFAFLPVGVAIVLGVFVLRRSNVARILLVISSSVNARGNRRGERGVIMTAAAKSAQAPRVRARAKPMAVAMVIGAHPLFMLAASARLVLSQCSTASC